MGMKTELKDPEARHLRTVGVRMSDEQYEKVERLAKESKMSESAVIRSIVADWFESSRSKR